MGSAVNVSTDLVHAQERGAIVRVSQNLAIPTVNTVTSERLEQHVQIDVCIQDDPVLLPLDVSEDPAARQVEVLPVIFGVMRPVDLRLDLGPDVHVARYEIEPIVMTLDLVASGLRPGGNQTTRGRAIPENAYGGVRLHLATCG